MKPQVSRPSPERGAILPMFAIMLLVLIGFAAVGVDLGYRHAERRNAQTAADTAALGAAVKAFVGGGDLQAAIEDAMAIADTNTSWSITAADWEGCTDANALAITVADLLAAPTNPVNSVPSTPCISFSSGYDEVRVSLPVAEVKTFFAGAIGFDTLPVTAAAQASITPPSGQATPPFVVLPPGTAGEQVCLRTSNNAELPGQWIGNGPGDAPENQPTLPLKSELGFTPDPCDDLAATPQFFGTLKPYFYADINPDSGPDQSCSQINGSIPLGIARGIDHPLSSFEPDYDFNPAGPQVRVDGDGCKGPPVPWPNTLDLQSGFTAQILKEGLLTGGTIDATTFAGRLQTGFMQSGDPKFAGWQVENRPLWSYLADDVTSPLACQQVQDADATWDYFDKRDTMIKCLRDWKDDDGTLFKDELFDAARFAIIPVVAESSFGPPGAVHFNSFVPVFFQTLYQYGNEIGSPDPRCFAQAESASGNAGWYRHQAGQDFDCGRSSQNVDRVSAIVLDCAMMSSDLCTPDPNPGPEGTPVYEVLLTR